MRGCRRRGFRIAALPLPAFAFAAGIAGSLHAAPSGSVGASPPLAYVDVAVATIWTRPSAPRAIDQPALGNPARIRSWTRSLDTAARRGLVGRIETQALLGEPVRILRRRGAWVEVAVVNQPTPRSRWGYPGWVPRRQLVASSRFGRLAAGHLAIVTAPTAQLRSPGRVLEVSYATRLPLLASTGREVRVATPSGEVGRLSRTAVKLSDAHGRLPGPTGRQIAAAARAFIGVRYLWGGTSAFGFDCSGLVELVYRAHGIVLPRDADAQALRGEPVAMNRLRIGDSLFYGRRHVHHTALYVGAGRMIEAPNSASTVRIGPIRTYDYAGARRYAR